MTMQRMIKKSIAALILTALLITAIPSGALASSFSAVVTASEMLVYKTPYLTGDSASLPQGTVVTVKAYKNGVAQISYNGYTCYASVNDMEKVESSSSGTKVKLLGDLTVYKTASTSSDSRTVSAGYTVTVAATKDGWCKLVNGKYSVYALEADVKAAMTEQEPEETEVAAATDETVDAVVSVDTMKVYAKPDTSSNLLGTLTRGTHITVTAVSGDWARLEKNGNIGYALKAQLTKASEYVESSSTESSETTSKTAVVTVSKVNVYKLASTSSKVLGTLKQGETVEVTAVKDKWAQVVRNGVTGYTAVAALADPSDADTTATDTTTTETTASTTSVAAVANTTMPVYSKASTSSTKLGTLKKGVQVNVLAVKGNWAYIELNGKKGFTGKAGLTEVTEEESTSADTTKVLFTATVTANSMVVYKSASTDSTKLGKLSAGSTVDVYAYNDTWAFIGKSGNYGFALVSDMTTTTYSMLKSGDTGDAVAKLNSMLLSLGYYDAVPSSSYDQFTVAAVKRLQSALNMTETGTADSTVLARLAAGTAPSSSMLSTGLSKGDSGTNVMRLQTRLYALGYLSKTSSIDGEYGTTTQKAVALFQNAMGLTVNGTASTGTIQKLYSSSAVKATTAAENVTTTSLAAVTDTDTGVTSSSPISAEGQKKIEIIIAAAKEKLGCKYVYATAGPNTFDCTGFTKYCFAKVGVTLGRSAYAVGYGNAGTKIAYSGLVRGDIVCFNTVSDSDLSDHAGIYLGGGQFIHCSSGKGCVVISDLTSGYYNRVFSWGKRFIY